VLEWVKRLPDREGPMYTLPHQFEFLSDEWLAEARAFLERELEKDPRPAPFSLSETFTDTPPHLHFPGDVGGWSFSFDGQTVTVSRDTRTDADLVVEGDYQAALSSAQRVGLTAPGAYASMGREVAQQFGPGALVAKGGVDDRRASEVLAHLHDHLGRRTVENPDLYHRASRQGLLANIAEMEEQGYTVLERAISPEFADELRAATLQALSDQSVSSLQWMLYQGRPFELLAQHPQLMTLIDASLGRGAVIASLSAIRRGSGPGTIPLHNDYAQVPVPYPEFALTGVGVWALEDWTVASGPTWLVPGTHRLRRPPRPDEEVTGAIPIEMPKGSVVFFTEALWHWQGDRSEPGERVTLHWHFNRGILRSLEPKKVDPQMLHRNSPRLGEMLGEDDWFDKMAGIGRDHERFAHMRHLQAFTNQQKAAILQETAGILREAAGSVPTGVK
jgi:ectoine hydroxylase-related dioxygenase (phytanoyl-CoA dioxygenase family)